MESVFNLPWINHSPIVLGTVTSTIAFFTRDHCFSLTNDSLVATHVSRKFQARDLKMRSRMQRLT